MAWQYATCGNKAEATFASKIFAKVTILAKGSAPPCDSVLEISSIPHMYLSKRLRFPRHPECGLPVSNMDLGNLGSHQTTMGKARGSH